MLQLDVLVRGDCYDCAGASRRVSRPLGLEMTLPYSDSVARGVGMVLQLGTDGRV